MCFSEADVIIGGLLPNSSVFGNFSLSKAYFPDDLTWCVRKSRNFPMVLNFLFVATPTCWIIMIFGIGYVSGFAIYIMIQFDLKYKARNHRDLHYTIWLISLPAVIGINQRFQPKSVALRTFTFFYAFIMFMSGQFIFWFGITYIKTPTPRPQISTISTVIDYKYQLFGSI